VMVGGALPPFKLLVGHLSSQRSSVHPIVDMHKNDVERLEIRSDMAFDELPLPRSNIWLMDLLAYKPSTQQLNDILIIHLDSINGTRKMKDPKQTFNSALEPISPWPQRNLLDLISFITSLFLLTSLAFSILLGDMWAAVLFFLYLLHSLASAAVAFTTMLTTSDSFGTRVREDATLRFAVHSRSAGGKVVFVGRQDTLETLARTAWTFNKTPTRNFLHWSWMLTGSLSAAASVICMVNMAGTLQLAYLGTMILSSFGELLVNRLVRQIQNTAIHYGSFYLVGDSEYWTQSIIRSALGTNEDFCLADLPWCEFNLLPDIPLFQNLCIVLSQLRKPGGAAMTETEIEAKLSDQVERKQLGLMSRLAEEIKVVRKGKALPAISKLF